MADTLEQLYNDLLDLSEKGDEVAAEKLLEKRFKELPEDVQADILTRLYFGSVVEDAANAEGLAGLQRRAVTMIETLEAMRKKIEAGA